jgi:hypothetical protein
MVGRHNMIGDPLSMLSFGLLPYVIESYKNIIVYEL